MRGSSSGKQNIPFGTAFKVSLVPDINEIVTIYPLLQLLRTNTFSSDKIFDDAAAKWFWLSFTRNNCLCQNWEIIRAT